MGMGKSPEDLPDADGPRGSNAGDLAEDTEAIREQLLSAMALGHLGAQLQAQGDTAGAVERFREALDIFEDLAADTDLVDSFLTASAHCQLAGALADRGDHHSALEHAQIARDTLSRFADAHPGEPVFQGALTLAHNTFGKVLAARGDLSSALREFETARSRIEDAVADDPTDPRLRGLAAEITCNRGAELLLSLIQI